MESDEEAVILERIEQGRQKIAQAILEAVARRTGDLGIELLDLRFKRIAYVEEVQKDVFARMIAERCSTWTSTTASAPRRRSRISSPARSSRNLCEPLSA